MQTNWVKLKTGIAHSGVLWDTEWVEGYITMYVGDSMSMRKVSVDLNDVLEGEVEISVTTEPGQNKLIKHNVLDYAKEQGWIPKDV